MIDRSRAFATAVFAISLVLASGSHAAEPAAATHHTAGHPHWSYEGETGPDHWSAMEKAFEECKLGKLQSPIDIPSATLKPTPLDRLRFEYKAAPLREVDNGHTVMVSFAPGSKILVGSSEYELQQVHFHHPSEEKIDGKPFAMVAHLVHKNKEGKLAVVAVLFQEGAANPGLASVFGHLPATKEKEETPAGASIDANALLPAKHGYFTFYGSLTTPPCTEGVRWFVLREPQTASAEQIDSFAKLYPNNARPVQAVGGRKIEESE